MFIKFLVLGQLKINGNIAMNGSCSNQGIALKKPKNATVNVFLIGMSDKRE